MKIAYADPPYIGQAAKHYADHPDYAGEVDHDALIRQLVNEYPDGWALSCSSPSLRYLLPLCPEDVRMMAWVKPFASFKPNVNPAYAWEPVIVRGGRQPRDRSELTVRDWVAANITLRKGLSGVKPPEFCTWLFAVMGLERGDDFVDLFPGSGAVSRAWETAVILEKLWESATYTPATYTEVERLDHPGNRADGYRIGDRFTSKSLPDGRGLRAHPAPQGEVER